MSTLKDLHTAIAEGDLRQVIAHAKAIVPDTDACIMAVKSRRHDILEALIVAGADLNKREAYKGYTPMVIALRAKDFNAVRLLLKHGASPSVFGTFGPPLAYAASEGFEEIVDLFIGGGANLEQRDSAQATPLIRASRNGHLSVVKMLLDAGADPYAVDCVSRTALDNAKEYGQKKVAALLSRYCSESTKLKQNLPKPQVPGGICEAIRRKDLALMERCIDFGADVNGEDNTGFRPLSLAVAAGDLDCVRFLLKHGAKVGYVSKEGASPLDTAVLKQHASILAELLRVGAKPHSTFPLFTACAVGDLRMVKALIAANYDPHEVAKTGETPLLGAAGALSLAVVKLLLAKEVKVDVPNPYGWTALMSAVFSPAMTSEKRRQEVANKNSLAIAKLLIGKGANINHRNVEGRTPIMYACSKEMTQFLTSVGAKLDVRDKQGHDVQHWLKMNGAM